LTKRRRVYTLVTTAAEAMRLCPRENGVVMQAGTIGRASRSAASPVGTGSGDYRTIFAQRRHVDLCRVHGALCRPSGR
jgi:hypothetical protein